MALIGRNPTPRRETTRTQSCMSNYLWTEDIITTVTYKQIIWMKDITNNFYRNYELRGREMIGDKAG